VFLLLQLLLIYLAMPSALVLGAQLLQQVIGSNGIGTNV